MPQRIPSRKRKDNPQNKKLCKSYLIGDLHLEYTTNYYTSIIKRWIVWFKNGKRSWIQFSKEDKQMAFKKYTKRYSTLLAIREKEIKTKMTPVKMVLSKGQEISYFLWEWTPPNEKWLGRAVFRGCGGSFPALAREPSWDVRMLQDDGGSLQSHTLTVKGHPVRVCHFIVFGEARLWACSRIGSSGRRSCWCLQQALSAWNQL